jgi:hypothetical protein
MDILWLVARAEHQALLPKAFAQSFATGGAGVVNAHLPKAKPCIVITVDNVKPKRPPRWPDVLADWHEINDEDPLFPEAALAVLGEELSSLGGTSCVVHHQPAGKATVCWYEAGALEVYEHVGSSSVAFTPAGGLGRPFDGTVKSALALGGKKLASKFGLDDDVLVLDRIGKANMAIGETIVRHALTRIFDETPPPLDDLAGIVAKLPVTSFRG